MTLLRLEDHAADIAGRLLAERPAAVILDFDGTLTEIAEDPHAPRLTPERRGVLSRTVAIPGLHVAIVSGRALADVRDRVGVPGVTVIGNHGFEIEGVSVPGVAEARPALRAFLESLRDSDGLPPIEVEDKGATGTIHLRGVRTVAARDQLMRLLTGRLDEVPAAAALRLHAGKNIVEVRPAVDWDKARAVRILLERWGVPAERALYAGDDVTDECVFEALRDGVTIRVGEGDTSARYYAEAPGAIFDFMKLLTEASVPSPNSGNR